MSPTNLLYNPLVISAENSFDFSTDDETALAVAMAFLGGFFAFALVAAFVLYVLQIIAQWKLFTKAGEAGWKCLIPFYNYYIQYKITWNAVVYWIWLALAILSCFLTGKEGVMGTIAGIIALVLFVIGIVEDYKLSVSYGHGIGFTIGLILLHPLFILILGLGDSEYIGPNGER